jgi:putative flippase GtrA
MLLKQLNFFLVIGLITVSIDYLLYRSLTEIISNLIIAKFLSFAFGTIFSFIANRSITFNNKNHFWSHLSKFIILYLTTLFLNVIVNSASLEIFAWYNFKVQVSFLFATIISALTNFAGMKYIVFKKS